MNKVASVKTKTPVSSIERITPPMAKQMLKKNTKNRPLAPSTISKYASDMKAQKWVNTGEPIIFSTEGILLDGQHRLEACVLADTSFEAYVVRGVDPKAFAFIDVGLKRTAGHIFAIHKVENYNAVAAITLSLWRFEQGYVPTDGGGNEITRLDHQELYEYYTKRSLEIQSAMQTYKQFAGSKLANPSLMATLYIMCSRINPAQAGHLFEVSCSGVSEKGVSDPAFALHKIFVRAAISGERLGRKQTAGLVITAWNKLRKKQSGKRISYNIKDPVPTMI